VPEGIEEISIPGKGKFRINGGGLKRAYLWTPRAFERLKALADSLG